MLFATVNSSTGPHVYIIGIALVLKVIYGAQITFTETPKNVMVDEGVKAQFNCTAVSAQPSEEPIYFWKFNGKYIEDSNSNGFRRQDRSLIIQDVNATIHQGIYHCIAFKATFGAIISPPAYLYTTYLTISPEYSTPYFTNRTSYLLIKAPIIHGRPEPLLNWQYKQKNGRFASVNTDDTYVTKHGDLLIPSISKKYGTDFKLFVSQATKMNSKKLAAEISVTVIGPSTICFDNSIVFPVREQDRNLNEGQSLLLECVGVAKRCSLQRTAYWELRLGGTSHRLPARHYIQSVTPSNDGTYICHASVGNETQTYSVLVRVKGKPAVTFPPPNDINVLSSIPISVGGAENYTVAEWYTNAELITGSTSMMRKNRNSHLQFTHLSQSLSGVYQIFYKNGDLTTVRNINIFAQAVKDFGWKVSGLSGSINFKPSSLSSGGTVTYSSWLIAVPAIRTVYLTITSPPKCSSDGTTQLHVYQGSPANGQTVRNMCKDMTFTPMVENMKGPFITLVLVTRNISNGAFSAVFDVNPPAVTTPTPSTKVTTPSESTTSTTLSTPSKNTTKQGASVPSTDASTAAMSTNTATTTITQKKTTVPPSSNGRDKAAESQVGPIVGAIVGAAILIVAVIIILFCYRQRQEQKRKPANSPDLGHTEKGQNMSRNTYLMRRPGADPQVPCFRVQQPTGRPMPDLIPEYDAVAERIEMGLMTDFEDGDNQTYERVEDILPNLNNGSPGIGNLAYEPTKSPKAVIGRRIPSGQEGHNPKVIRADVSPRPLDRSVMHQKQQLGDATYDEVDESGYLEPVNALPRLLSMEGRPLPSPSETSPVYQTLEAEEEDQSREQGNDLYESAGDVAPDDVKIDETELKGSDYQPLTLDRDAKALYKHGENGILDADSTTSSNKEDPGGDYSEPYESARGIARANDNQNEYQPIGEIEPRSENNNHKKLESVENSCYESLDNTKGNIATHGDTLGCTGDTLGCTGDYQQLTLPRGPSNGAGL